MLSPDLLQVTVYRKEDDVFKKYFALPWGTDGSLHIKSLKGYKIATYAKCYMQKLYIRVKHVMKLQYWHMDLLRIKNFQQDF